jgi:hypothetical protein
LLRETCGSLPGAMGQYVSLVPEHDAVVVTTASQQD